MCGICGAWMPDGAPAIQEETILAMREAIHHRGPDDGGHWISPDGRVALGSRRLSIIDLSPAGHMPMWNEDGSMAIVFNGECYNFPELRQELVQKGHRFRSQTDTEVVLRLYQDAGPEEMLRRLRGMYALAIWDVPRRRLLLARDRFGIKPVYYARSRGALLFSSEVRGLLANPLVSLELDPQGVQGYFALGSVPNPVTPLAEVRALAPAHYLLLEDGRETLRPYWRLQFEEDNSQTESDWLQQIRAALLDSVRRHLVADRPVGIFLSGGIDSSALVALARHVEHQRLRTYSVVFEEAGFTEAAFSRQIAEIFQTEHHEFMVTGADALRQMDTMVAALDLPSLDGINTYLVTQVTRGDGIVVALSGLGSDEIFFGYPSFRWVPRLSRLGSLGRLGRSVGKAATPLTRAARMAAIPGSPTPLPAAYYAFRGILEPSFLDVLFRPEVRNGRAFDAAAYLNSQTAPLPSNSENAVSAMELRAYMHNQLLRDSDTMSMAHSLELRVPFVDHPLAELMARVPAAMKRSAADMPKHLLLKALPAPLPQEVWQRKKQGFTLPFAVWLRKELRGMAEDALVAADSPLRTLCRPEALRCIWDGFLAGRVHWSRVWMGVVFSRWMESL